MVSDGSSPGDPGSVTVTTAVLLIPILVMFGIIEIGGEAHDSIRSPERVPVIRAHLANATSWRTNHTLRCQQHRRGAKSETTTTTAVAAAAGFIDRIAPLPSGK